MRCAPGQTRPTCVQGLPSTGRTAVHRLGFVVLQLKKSFDDLYLWARSRLVVCEELVVLLLVDNEHTTLSPKHFHRTKDPHTYPKVCFCRVASRAALHLHSVCLTVIDSSSTRATTRLCISVQCVSTLLKQHTLLIFKNGRTLNGQLWITSNTIEGQSLSNPE